MPELALDGCRSEPLASYLKALGILRLVGAQIDANATGRWADGRFVLNSPLDLGGLTEFLVDRYVPTPIVAPWNKGSGFGDPDDSSSPAAAAAVTTIERSNDERLAPYRSAIAVVNQLRARPGWYQLPKEQQVALCRNHLPDDCLAWLDATIVLAGDRAKFPPLLGTGGNDGRLDFGSNYMQRLADLLGVTKRSRGAASSAELARAALDGDRSIRNEKAAIGQFDPAGAGGPASSPLGTAEALVNPWDYVLLLEGALMFASGAARRLSTGTASAAVPFIVDSSRAGHPSWSDDETSRGELWAPLWSHASTAAEIAQLMGEGRAEYRPGKQARNGVDLARSVAALGVDRRITSFTRYAFAERNGLSTFAVSLGTIAVEPRPTAAPLWQLDRWVRPLRSTKSSPQRIPTLLRRLDDAQFAAATGRGATALQDVLVTIAELEHAAQRSAGLRKVANHAVAGLRATQWVPLLDDDTPELQLAVSLASLRARSSERSLLRSVLGDPTWTGKPPPVTGLFERPVVDLLGDVLIRLTIDHPHTTPDGAPRWLGGPAAVPCPLEAVEAFVRRDVDDERLRRLLAGCLLLDWRSYPTTYSDEADRRELGVSAHPSLALLLPFFHRRDPLRGASDRTLLAIPSWAQQLQRGDLADVLDDARRRLVVAGLEPATRRIPLSNDRHVRHELAQRLAAACLVPLSDWGVGTLLDRATVGRTRSRGGVEPPDDLEDDTEPTAEEATTP